MSEGPLATVLEISDIHEGMVVCEELLFSEQDIKEFARLSGDYNPLHMSAEFARERGFGGAVVHGALIISKISKIVGMRLPGCNSVWTSLNLTFERPLIVGCQASLTATVAFVSQAASIVELAI
ncbi:MAG TPA: MaoC/PaaZ C-terminal domain-containing protein, partial [Burkholderiaceae bacterium]|nr:MaoC/PaaZ C-terminal domain-containing protein [Burkholderiaceae bacterium]